MKNVFLEHIWVMYFLWFAAGAMLLAYIGYRRKRKNPTQTHSHAPKTGSHPVH